MQACKGSWDRAAAPTSGVAAGRGPGGGVASDGIDRSADPEDLLGKGQDADGERSEHMCSDGYDNDHDGKTDCEDLGCRLDTSVVNCQPATNFRFSVVARTQGTYDVQEKKANVEFSAIQLRVLGQIPYIQNSFFLLSFRAEKTPRLVFAIFQVPIKGGHYFNLNSGSGSLSLELVRSIHKRLLVDPAYYMLNGFEQGNGAAIEFGGPLDKRGKFLYRTFLAGGSGRFAGNVGGTFFPDNNNNFTYTAGAQIWMNLIGYYNRYDSPILYTPAPTTLSLAVGAKRLWVVMDHMTKEGQSKLVRQCSYPLTAPACVTRVYTSLAVLDIVPAGFKVIDMVPGLSFAELQARTDAPLLAD